MTTKAEVKDEDIDNLILWLADRIPSAKLTHNQYWLKQAIKGYYDEKMKGSITGYYCVKNGNQIRGGTATLDKNAYSGVTVVPVSITEIKE